MEQQHESDLVKRLEQFGIEVDVSPTGTTLTYVLFDLILFVFSSAYIFQ
jgi:hypothetical protein